MSAIATQTPRENGTGGAHAPMLLALSFPDDPVSAALHAECVRRGVAAIWLRPGQLAQQPLVLTADRLTVCGRPIGAMVLRFPDSQLAGEGFEPEDQQFVAAELRAVLMCAMHLPHMLSVNAATPEAWFQGLDWVVWRRRFSAAGLAVSPLAYGDAAVNSLARWRPYLGRRSQKLPCREARRALGCAITWLADGDRSIALLGRIIDGPATPTRTAAATLLAEHGVLLAEIWADEHDRISHTSTVPTGSKEQIIERIASELATVIQDHLSCG